MAFSRVCLWAIAGIAAITTPTSAQEIDACRVLSPAAIRQTIGEPLQSTKLTTQTRGELMISQCVYSLPTFTNSISVTVTQPSSADAHHDAAREAWDHYFHPGERKKDAEGDRHDEAEEEEASIKPEPISGIGDEAFWIRSFVGNLYVRSGECFVRISIGGKQSPEQRLVKAKELAIDALKRM